ncbi:hypothetical protein D3C71_1538840 [compost metagenome]
MNPVHVSLGRAHCQPSGRRPPTNAVQVVWTDTEPCAHALRVCQDGGQSDEAQHRIGSLKQSQARYQPFDARTTDTIF